MVINKIHNGDTTLNVTFYPLEKAETVILLHGGPGVPNTMDPVCALLREKYQVVYFEQRGTGMSFCKNDSYKMEDYISDIDAIANHFQLNNFHLFGHSWGGLYAQIYADASPSSIKSLFLCSPSSGTNTTWKETESEVLKFNRKTSSNIGWLMMGWYSLLGALGSDNAYRKLFKQVYKNYHKGNIEYCIDDKELAGITAKPINKTRPEIIKYKNIRKCNDPSFSICITYGVKDVYGKSKSKLLERYPSAENFEILQSGHIPWLHNPTEFEKILCYFYGL